MHTSIAKLLAAGLPDAAIAYELGCELADLDRLEPTDAQAAILTDLQVGAGRWHAIEISERHKPLRVRHTYLRGSGQLVDWAAPNRVARAAMGEDIPARLAAIAGPDPIDVTFRFAATMTERRSLQQWKERWSHGDVVAVIVDELSRVASTERPGATIRPEKISAYVSPHQPARLWPQPPSSP